MSVAKTQLDCNCCYCAEWNHFICICEASDNSSFRENWECFLRIRLFLVNYTQSSTKTYRMKPWMYLLNTFKFFFSGKPLPKIVYNVWGNVSDFFEMVNQLCKMVIVLFVINKAAVLRNISKSLTIIWVDFLDVHFMVGWSEAGKITLPF